MKKFIAILLLSFMVLPIMAQETTTTITKIHVKKTKYLFKTPKYYTDFFVDLGFNRLDKSNIFNGNEDIHNNSFPKLKNVKSKSFALYAMAGRKIAGPLSISAGIGMDWVNYRFSTPTTLVENADNVSVEVPIKDIFSNFEYYQKSKLTASYVNAPIMLRLDFRRFFFVAAGITGGFNIGSHTKINYTDVNGNNHKYKDHNIHLAPFRYGFVFRAGFNHLSFFANYTMSPLFSKNEGPQLYPYSIGISFKFPD